MSTDNTITAGGHKHAHHFKDELHEFEACKFGVWLFLATEILMFGGLFVGYFLYQAKFPEMFAEGASFLDWRYGTVNTFVLLISSLTMALSIHYAQKNNKKLCVINLVITLLCAGAFMVIKYLEYSHKFHLGLFPGEAFSYAEATAPNLAMYFSFYFLMTGLHGSHVLIGMGLITWVLIRASKNEFNSEYYTPLEGVGLFWHLVDLIWIYLFPILYLI